MKDHYDVGIVGCWYWGNYGSLLNGYATHCILKSIGLSAMNIITPYNGFEDHAQKFINTVYSKEEISPLYDFDQVSEFNKVCDMFLNGSDQIWNYDPMANNERFRKFFMLDFTHNDKRRVSYGTSMGKYIKEDYYERKEFCNLLRRYNAISVRENETVEILRKDYGINSTRVMEPVFALKYDNWMEIAEYSDYSKKEPYILTYILDPTPEKREAINFYSEKAGLKAINILDGFTENYEYNKRALDLSGTLPNIWCADFIKLFSGAEFVITDSFHGVCFSLIFNKPFLAIGNYMRGIKRFETILELVGMKDRLVYDPNSIPHDEKYLNKIDFTNANKTIEEENKRSVEWLKNALLAPIEKLPPVEIINVNTTLDKNLCMGCGACVSVCPVDAIHFKTDEYGLYKAKVDYSKCINCKKCVEVCAAIDLPRNLNTPTPISYAFITSNQAELMSCTSGGAATVLAKSIIDKGGAVVGAAWTDDFVAEHMFAYTKDDLESQKKSKYFQSYLGDTFKKIKEKLFDGKPLMFIGTPCQTAGLRKYLGRSYSNLFIIDLLCANCPSSGLFKKYLSEKFDLNELSSYSFRHKFDDDKIMGENTSFVKRKDGSGEILKLENDDDYLKVFHGCSLSLAYHCLKCKYQGSMRVGDLTLGDCWGIQNYDRSVDVSKGVSLILVNNTKGEELLSSVPNEYIKVLREEPLEEAKKYNAIAFTSNRNWPDTLKRRVFHEYVKTKSYHEAKQKAEPIENGKMSYFYFDPTYWSDDYTNDVTVLSTKMMYPEIGRFCMLALPNVLEKGRRYKFKIKFKISTSSPDFNFCIKRSNSGIYQVIHVHRIVPQNKNTWIVLEEEFIPNNDFYDEFMMGAAQLRGENRYIAIKYIKIEDN